MSDDENRQRYILQRIAAHDTDAFRLVLREHQGIITRVAVRLLNGDRDGAADIAQEAFVRLWQNAANVPHDGIRPYLLTLVYRLCCDRHRRRRHEVAWKDDIPEPIAPLPLPQQQTLDRERATIIQSAIQQLPEEQRIVLILHHYEQLSYEEIARIVPCPPGTVASRLHLAKRTLHRRLSPYINPSREDT